MAKCGEGVANGNDGGKKPFNMTEAGRRIRPWRQNAHKNIQICGKLKFHMSSLLQAANFVETIQSRQGIVVSAPEEIAFLNGFIDKDKLCESAKAYGKSPYGEHLKAVAEGRVKYWFRYYVMDDLIYLSLKRSLQSLAIRKDFSYLNRN